MIGENKKNFFLLSFIPAIAYWYLEAHYSLKIALIGGVGLALIEVLTEKMLFKKVHKISLFNFYLLSVLGGIALLGEDGLWFKLQPTFTGILMAAFLVFKKIKGTSFMYEALLEMDSKKAEQINQRVIIRLESQLVLFLVLYSLFMIYCAVFMSTDFWLFFKTAGFYISFVLFMIVCFVFNKFSYKRG